MKLRKRNKDISNTSSEIKLGKGKRHRLSHPAFILVLAIVSCIGVGFSSWNVGNTSAFVEIDATVGKLVTGTVVADCFVSASVNADFSVCDQGLDVAGEVVDSADLVYEIGFNAAEASDNNLLTSSTDGSVFSFTIDFSCNNSGILSSSSYFGGISLTSSTDTGYYSEQSIELSNSDESSLTYGVSMLCSSDVLTISDTTYFYLSFGFTGNFYSLITVSPLTFNLSIFKELA